MHLASVASVELAADGRLRVLTAQTEMGQGTKTVFPQMVAAELGVPEPPLRPGIGTPTGKRCSNDRLMGTGFSLRYPTYREGYRTVLAGEGAEANLAREPLGQGAGGKRIQYQPYIRLIWLGALVMMATVGVVMHARRRHRRR